MFGSGSGLEKIMDPASLEMLNPDPVCPERLDPDPVCPESLDPDQTSAPQTLQHLFNVCHKNLRLIT